MELLVVVALILVLIGLSLPVYRKVRLVAAQAKESSALRQVLLAWTNYATDHNARVMPGYLPGLTASDQLGEPIPAGAYGGGPTIAARYPWRLAPYLGAQMSILYSDEARRTMESMPDAGTNGEYLYFTSLYPAFGMNSTFIGGDSERGGFLPASLPNGQQNPLSGFYVQSLARVQHPGNLLVFASSRTSGTAQGDIMEGFFRVEAPWFTNSQWAPKYEPSIPAACGNISARFDQRVVCGFVDCHVEAREFETLRDMRVWADGADTPNWHIAP